MVASYQTMASAFAVTLALAFTSSFVTAADNVAYEVGSEGNNDFYYHQAKYNNEPTKTEQRSINNNNNDDHDDDGNVNNHLRYYRNDAGYRNYDFTAPFHKLRDGRVVSRRQLLEQNLEPEYDNIDCDADRVCCTHDGICSCQPDEYQRADHQCVPYTPKNPDGVRCDFGVCDENTAVLGEWQCDDRLVEPHIYVPRNCNGSYSPDSTDYTTCKATRRCNWARQYYDVINASYTMSRLSFDAGRIEMVDLFNDFEGTFVAV